MDEEKFDSIVIGGGLAGLTAAYVMAEAGLAVLLVERGTTCGSKNVTGGKICSHSIEKLFPNFGEEAPVERKIVREKISDWGNAGLADSSIDPHAYGLSESESYSVVRNKLDAWLAEKAEEAGVMVITGINITDLIVREGKVCGIIADGEEMEADSVILAEGINGLLAQKIGMIEDVTPETTCVGTKEVIQLGEDVINERFGLNAGEGIEWMLMGNREDGQYADGFIYTNKDTVSVGIELLISDIYNTEKSVPDMLEELKAVPEVAALIEGGSLVEYSSHLVSKVKSAKLSKLYGDGVLLAGDTARLVANTGWSVRGMDLAVESGILAGQTIIEASEKGDFSEASLSSYQEAVENSFIASDLKACEAYYAGV